MPDYSHIHPEEDAKRFDSLLERYPWTRRYYDYGGKPIESLQGWFTPPLPMNDYPGWSAVFERMCGRIQDVLDKHAIPAEEFVIGDVKEKFARIRLYWYFAKPGEDGLPGERIVNPGLTVDFLGVGTIEGVGSQSAEELGSDSKYDEARAEIRQVLHDASDESYATCMFCGATDDISYTEGWVVPVCPDCEEAGVTHRALYVEKVYEPYIAASGASSWAPLF